MDLVLAFCFPSQTFGQGVAGTNLVIHVQVESVVIHRDTTRITYVVTNDARSREQMFWFMVDAPSPETWVSPPSPQREWASGTRYGEESVARWAALGERNMGPGDRSPPLTMAAIGLPTIVRSRARGYVPPPTVEEEEEDTPPEVEELNYVTDSTIGVQYNAVFDSGTELLERLHGLVDQTCGDKLKWITKAEACGALTSAADSAKRRLESADTLGSRSFVRAFLRELSAGHDAGSVTNNAYWLLKPNASFIVVRHLVPRSRLMPRDHDPDP